MAVLEGLAQHLWSQGNLDSFDGGGPTVDEPPPEQEWIDEFWDEITGAVLDPKAVKDARKLEVEYMHNLGVYVPATMAEAQAAGCKPIPTRWLDTNKGDEANPNIRSRLVAQETRRRSTIAEDDMASVFAATPPLEALKLLFAMSMSGQLGVPEKSRRVLGFYDISRAHFHSPARRELFVVPPPEDTTIKTGVARLCKAMYGTRDAAQCFDAFAEDSMQKLGFRVVVHAR